MKIRNGFVSNSSSSSFTCNICKRGWSEEYQDASPEDANMYECENGHVFCEQKIVEYDIDKHYKEISEGFIGQSERKKYDGIDDSKAPFIDKMVNYHVYMHMRANIPEKHCPICRFDHLIPIDVAQFLILEKKFLPMIEQTIGIDEIKKMMKEKHKSYHELKMDILYPDEDEPNDED